MPSKKSFKEDRIEPFEPQVFLSAFYILDDERCQNYSVKDTETPNKLIIEPGQEIDL